MNPVLKQTHSKSFDDSQADLAYVRDHTNDVYNDLPKLMKHQSTMPNENIKTRAFSTELSNLIYFSI